jgi:hypothetical protein
MWREGHRSTLAFNEANSHLQNLWLTPYRISAPKLRSIAGTDSGSDMEQGATPLGLMLNLTGPVSINFPDITRTEPLAAINGEIARWEALSR